MRGMKIRFKVHRITRNAFIVIVLVWLLLTVFSAIRGNESPLVGAILLIVFTAVLYYILRIIRKVVGHYKRPSKCEEGQDASRR